MTKSIPPSSFTHFSTATCMLSILLTSTDPNPKTLAPCLAVAISLAILSVFSTFRPMMQALAPRWTMARTWALQMVPAPPVQNTTLFARKQGVSFQIFLGSFGRKERAGLVPKIPSFQISLTYSYLGRGIFDVSITISDIDSVSTSSKTELQLQREDMRVFFREEWKDGLQDDIYARAEIGLNVVRISQAEVDYKLAIQDDRI